eukprot:5203436-Pleurochrysis_carterae.AAC.1
MRVCVRFLCRRRPRKGGRGAYSQVAAIAAAGAGGRRHARFPRVHHSKCVLSSSRSRVHCASPHLAPRHLTRA